MVCRKQFHVRMNEKRTEMVTNNCLRRKSVAPQIWTIEVERRHVGTWTSSLFLCGSAHLAGLTWVSASWFWICLACRSSSLFSGMVCAIWFYQNDFFAYHGAKCKRTTQWFDVVVGGALPEKYTGEPNSVTNCRAVSWDLPWHMQLPFGSAKGCMCCMSHHESLSLGGVARHTQLKAKAG